MHLSGYSKDVMLSGLGGREGEHLTGRNLEYVTRVKDSEQPQCFLM